MKVKTISANGKLNTGYLLIQLLNLGIFLAWVFLVWWSLSKLRKIILSTDLKMIWTLLIVFLPIIGGLAFWMLHKSD